MNKCTKCNSNKDIAEFGVNRKNLLYRTCCKCRERDKQNRDSNRKMSEAYIENNDWKELFGVPNSTHSDFRSHSLSQGWTQVHKCAFLSAH